MFRFLGKEEVRDRIMKDEETATGHKYQIISRSCTMALRSVLSTDKEKTGQAQRRASSLEVERCYQEYYHTATLQRPAQRSLTCQSNRTLVEGRKSPESRNWLLRIVNFGHDIHTRKDFVFLTGLLALFFAVCLAISFSDSVEYAW